MYVFVYNIKINFPVFHRCRKFINDNNFVYWYALFNAQICNHFNNHNQLEAKFILLLSFVNIVQFHFVLCSMLKFLVIFSV